MWDNVWFALTVTTPIFGWLVLGVGLRYLGWVTPAITSRLSALVYYISLPLLMFTSVARYPVATLIQPLPAAVVLGVTLSLWLLYRHWRIHRERPAVDRTVAEQAMLRGNVGIIGLPLCINAFGVEVLPKVSLLMAMITITYNIVCVFIFVDGLGDGRLKVSTLLKNLGRNPLILGIVAGALASLSGVHVPESAFEFSGVWLQITLPLAIVAIGASLNFSSFMRYRHICYEVAALKLGVLPLLAVWIMLGVHADAQLIGIVFLLCASPTATISFVMARVFGANDELAATLVVMTTGVSLLTISAGLFVLRVAGVV